jgi:hypothetical protein
MSIASSPSNCSAPTVVGMKLVVAAVVVLALALDAAFRPAPNRRYED